MSKATPLVSIGVPVYNAADTLPKALDGLLEQDYASLEIILSDNASTDGTPDICREYAARDPRIRFSANETNLGVFGNFKKVLREARGEYFMWAAADDFWTPPFVSRLTEGLQANPKAGVAMSAIERIRPDGSHLDEIRFTGDRNPNGKSRLAMSLAMISNIKYNLFIYGLFRRDLLSKAFFSAKGGTSADRWFLCRFALGAKFHYVDELLHVRTNHKLHFSKRYPGDPYGASKVASERKWIDLGPVTDMASEIAHASYIPFAMKLWMPIVLTKLFFFRVKWSLYPRMKTILADTFGTTG